MDWRKMTCWKSAGLSNYKNPREDETLTQSVYLLLVSRELIEVRIVVDN